MRIPIHFLLILCAAISISFVRIHAQNSWIPTSLTSNIGAMASNSQGHLFAHGYQLFRSTDNGVTWLPIASEVGPEGTFKSIGIRTDGHIFIGRYRSVWHSRDNGDTWVKIDTTMGDVHSFAFNNANEIFAASTVRGMYKSTNDGDSWQQTSTTNGLSIVIDGNGKLYAAMNSSVYSSTDQGVTWIQAGNAPNAQTLRVNSSGHVFAGTFSSGMFRTTDGGAHWLPINYGSVASWISGFAFDSLGYVYASSRSAAAVYRSTDNGDSWTQINRGLVADQVMWVFFERGLFAGTSSNNVFQRNEILTWAPLPPVPLAPINGATHIPINPILSWNRSTNAASYSLFVARDSNFSQVDYSNGSITDTSVQLAGLSYTTTHYWRLRGTNPEEGASGWSNTLRFTTVFPLLSPPTLVSPGNAASNVVINPTLVWNRVTSSLAYSVQIAADPGFNSIVYENLNVSDTTVRTSVLQYNAEYFWRTRTVRSDSTSAWSLPWHFVTADHTPLNHFPLTVGNSWSIVSKNLSSGTQSYYLKQIESDTILADGRLYAALRNYFRPAGGTTWTPGNWEYLRLEGGRVYMFPDSLLVDFDSTTGSCLPGLSPRICIVGDNRWEWLGRTSRMLTLSRNNGYDFWSYVDSIGFGVISASQFQNYFPIYTIGARINGVEYGNVMAVEENPSGLPPASFFLSQNYPNPFQPTTKIEFRIANFGFVSLKVFDLLGIEVATLVNEEMMPGSYEKVFNASELASGVYFYRLQAGSFVQTRKLILIK